MIHELLPRNDVASASPLPESAETSPPRRASDRKRSLAAFVGWLGQAALTAIVLAALGGLALWGHHTGWKIPKFSSLMGDPETPKDDWCEAHGVPESICVECH